MNEPQYQVMLEGRKVGPYDRRTIVGMRIKQTLSSEHVLVASDGSQLTVADLLRAPPRDNSFQPNRSGSYSLVQATYSGSLVAVQGPGMDIPRFKDEIEVRVQSDVLRLAGRFRHGIGWKEDRVKVPLKDIAHARVRGTVVDLWVRTGGDAFQRITLELFSPEAAGEFVEWLPGATPWPEADSQPAVLVRQAGGFPFVWAAVIGSAITVGGVIVLVISRLLR